MISFGSIVHTNFEMLSTVEPAGLQKLGWVEGRNIRIDTRWAAGDTELMQRFAKELVALQPDLMLSHLTPTTTALLQQTRTIPIVFALVADPIGSGFVASFARPGGNVTGFIFTEPTMAGKWLELLKEIAPGVTRVAMMFNPATATYANGSPISMPDSFADAHRVEIISLAARYRLPAVYPYRFFTELGGLLSYGVDVTDNFRRAATYADRVLKGEKPSDLPVQAPVKFELVINLKAAKTLGLTVPLALQVAADEVIE